VVYGFNDGLTANFGLVAGMIGAQGSLEMASHTVVVAGLAGMMADALSMGASGYLAAKSEREVFEHEIAMEREEIRLMPDLEREELSLLYQAKGIPEHQAAALATRLMADPERALEEKVREELKIGHRVRRPHPGGAAAREHQTVGGVDLLRPRDDLPLRRRCGPERVHRPERVPQRARHVPRRPRRGGGRLCVGRLDRRSALVQA
jgi:VIT1/CCC1 family predicted Fe2+/Mn2+ transporter